MNQGDNQILLVAVFVLFVLQYTEVMKQFVILKRLSAKFSIGRGR